MNPKETLEYAKNNEIRQVDLRFTDLPGLSQHISYPINMFDESSFEDGFGIDGSSIRGWAAINESDMLIIPDPSTAFTDPFAETRTLVMLGDIIDPDHRARRPQRRRARHPLRRHRHGLDGARPRRDWAPA